MKFSDDLHRDNPTDTPAPEASVKRAKQRGFLIHLHPARIPQAALQLNRTWGLGGMALVLFLLLAFSGILLMLAYQPTVAGAYQSVQAIQQQILFGRWVRNIHHWSGNLLVVVSVLHLLRVFFTGGFVGVRRANWWIGLALLFSVCVAVFTGYLLPWDQLSYWAITICTGMLGYLPLVGGSLQLLARGGTELGDIALRNYFTLHTSLLPAALIILMGFHFWRVRKAGGVILPLETAASQNVTVPASPHLVVRELCVALWLIAAVCLFSVFVDAPLQSIANPGMSPNPAKAPWYFMGAQELLLHFPPLIAVVVLPFLALAGLIALPFGALPATEEGVWFRSRRGLRFCVVAAVAGSVVTPCAVLFNEYIYRGGAIFADLPRLLTGGLLPLGLILFCLVFAYLWLRRKYAASSSEALQAIFVFLFVALVILTIIGIWFRGPGMALGVVP
jgi:quinol-cytochrome oxidoreductase complex cytochrome b subunit